LINIQKTTSRSARSVRRAIDVSSWQEADVSGLNSRNRRRYRKRKAAVTSYFTTVMPVEKLATYHHIPVAQLLQFVQQCLMLHEDGAVWGFRALVPGAHVVDASEQSEKVFDDPISAIEQEPLVEDARHPLNCKISMIVALSKQLLTALGLFIKAMKCIRLFLRLPLSWMSYLLPRL
jgi:hypothetical protein